MDKLYTGIAFSPPTTLTANIGAADTIIKVEDASVFPDAPNLATIGTDEEGETIAYAAKADGLLSGCTRGVEGTAKAWQAGSVIARNFTAQDHNDLIAAVTDAQNTADTAQSSAATAQQTADKAVADAASAQQTADGCLPLSGGVMTGAITVASEGIKGCPGTTDILLYNEGQAQVGFLNLPDDYDLLDEKTVRVNGIKLPAYPHDAANKLYVDRTRYNPNLLINWDFRNPVNRKGKTEYTTNGHSIDRWLVVFGSCKIIQNGVQIIKNNGAAYASFHQKFENVPDDTQITISAIIDGELVAATGVRANDMISNRTSTGCYVRIIAGSSTFEFIIQTDSCIIQAVKLELGDHQTLARKNTDEEWEIIDPPNYDLQYALCSLYSPITGDWVGYQHSNPNLLDNWYFADPVNQRGQTEYESAQYAIDRWLFDRENTTAKVILHSGFVTVQQGAWMRQKIEVDIGLLNGKTITVSMLLFNGTLLTVTTTFTAADSYVQAPWGSLGTFYSETEGIAVLAFASFNQDYDIFAAKLELGSVQTLAHKEGDTWVLNDPPPNKALELAKCQRYYWKPDHRFSTNTILNESRILCSVQFPVEMRGVPSIRIFSGFVKTENVLANWYSGEDTSVTATAGHPNRYGFDHLETVDAVPGSVYAFCIEADANP